MNLGTQYSCIRQMATIMCHRMNIQQLYSEWTNLDNLNLNSLTHRSQR